MSSAVAPQQAPPRGADFLADLPSRAARSPGRLWRLLSWTFGWAWRVAAGAALCFNAYLLSYLTSIMVVGWLWRWVQGRVLYGLWKASPLRREVPFEVFRSSLGPGAPAVRPRWVFPERGRRAPSFWTNFKIGFVALCCVYLLAGWGCALMTFSWEFGWVNSFAKGYEQALVGPLTGLAGAVLFAAAMFYVPMASAHAAATGDGRAFFDVRFVWRLVNARLTAYVGLAALIALVSLPLEVLKTAPLFFYESEAWRTATDAELLGMYRQYLFNSALVLFVSLLLVHAVAARVYRSALLKALRRGRIREEELHPTLALWLDRLELIPEPRKEPTGLAAAARWGLRWWYRRWLYATLALIWLAFVAKVYAGEFFNYHPFVGLMNHPLIQFPCVEYIPQGLQFPE